MAGDDQYVNSVDPDIIDISYVYHKEQILLPWSFFMVWLWS